MATHPVSSDNALSRLYVAVPTRCKVAALMAIAAVGLIYRNWGSICCVFYGNKPKEGAGDSVVFHCEQVSFTEEELRNLSPAYPRGVQIGNQNQVPYRLPWLRRLC